jgi:hypothetical protein
MKDIHKKININSIIERYKGMYGGYVYCERTMMYNFIQLHKVYTFIYGSYEFSMLIVDNRYRFIDYKGNYYDTSDFEQFKKFVRYRLLRVYGDI